MNPLSRVIPGGVPIKCVFPQCQTTWIFNMTTDPAKTNEARERAGWKYVQEVPTPYGPVWGWSCTDDTEHLIQHTEENVNV